MMQCCDCQFWKPKGAAKDAIEGFCCYRAPSAILPFRVPAKALAERDKFELGERDIPPRGFQPLHPITNALWGCGEGKPLSDLD